MKAKKHLPAMIRVAHTLSDLPGSVPVGLCLALLILVTSACSGGETVPGAEEDARIDLVLDEMSAIVTAPLPDANEQVADTLRDFAELADDAKRYVGYYCAIEEVTPLQCDDKMQESLVVIHDGTEDLTARATALLPTPTPTPRPAAIPTPEPLPIGFVPLSEAKGDLCGGLTAVVAQQSCLDGITETIEPLRCIDVRSLIDGGITAEAMAERIVFSGDEIAHALMEAIEIRRIECVASGNW